MITYLNLIINTLSRFWTALEHGHVLPVGNWNYVILFFFVIIQGPLVKLLSGAVVSSTYLNLYGVMTVAILASLSADLWWYYLGSKGKLETYFHKKNSKRKKMIEALQNVMQTHYFKVLLLGKLSLGMAIPSVIAAGVSHVPWRKWFPVVLLGEIIYTIMLVLLGFYAGESITHTNQTIRYIGIAFTAFLIIILIFYLPYNIRKTITKETQNLNDPIDL